MSTPSPTEMSSIHDLLTSLKLAFLDTSFSRIENELLSREERLKREIEMQSNVINEQKKEIDKQKSEIEEQQNEIDKQRKMLEDFEAQIEFVRLDRMRTEQDLKEECNKNEQFQMLLEQMKSLVSVAEEELVNFKSPNDSLKNSKKEVKTEADLINHKALPRHKVNGKPPSENIVEILDSDEDCAQSEIDVKKIPEKLSMDNLHLDQTVSEKESGVLKRKQALAVDEGNGNEDSHDRNEVVVDKSSDDRHKRVKVNEFITVLVNSPMNHLPETIKSPEQGSLQKKLKYETDDSDSCEGSSSSDDSDEDLLSDVKPIFIPKAQGNIDQKKWNCEVELKAALEKDETLCMKAVCAPSRQQNSSGKNVSDSSTLEHLGFDKLYAQSVAPRVPEAEGFPMSLDLSSEKFSLPTTPWRDSIAQSTPGTLGLTTDDEASGATAGFQRPLPKNRRLDPDMVYQLTIVNGVLKPTKKVSASFFDAFKNRPCTIGKFTRVPESIKMKWYEDWKSNFIWHDGLNNDEVYLQWRKQLNNRYRDIMSNIRKRPLNKKPHYLTKEQFAAIKAAEEDPTFRRQSEQNRQNRRAKERKSTGGSVSHVENARRPI